MSKRTLAVVDSLSIVSPCAVDDFDRGAQKIGGDWYCEHCEQRVFNIAAMSRKEVADLIERTEGNFCATIARRHDGSLITAEEADPARGFIVAGALIASTALLSGVAIAEETIGKVAVEAPSPSPQPSSTPTPEVKEECEKPTTQAEQKAAPQQTPRPLRGRVAIIK